MAKVGLIGIDKVMTNINRQVARMKRGSMAGLIEAAIVIRRDMDKTPPLIPVDVGNLRASWFITTARGPSEVGGGWKSTDKKGGKVDVSELAADHRGIVSAATSKARKAMHPIVIMGFSANYSVFVHEMKEGAVWNRTSSGPKFFESSLNSNQALVLAIIANNIRR